MSDQQIEIIESSIKNNIYFTVGSIDPPILSLSKEGFKYKGVRIEDAGKAHEAFLEVMQLMKSEVLNTTGKASNEEEMPDLSCIDTFREIVAEYASKKNQYFILKIDLATSVLKTLDNLLEKLKKEF